MKSSFPLMKSANLAALIFSFDQQPVAAQELAKLFVEISFIEKIVDVVKIIVFDHVLVIDASGHHIQALFFVEACPSWRSGSLYSRPDI